VALANELNEEARLHRAALSARDDLRGDRAELDQRRAQFAELEQKALALAKERGGEALGAGDVALARQDQLADVQLGASSKRRSLQQAQQLAQLGPAPVPSAQGRPQSPFPYRLPAAAAVVEGLGEVSGSGIRSRGVVIATSRGASLATPASGTILFSGPFRDFDGVIVIDHGSGWKSVIVNAASTLPRGSRLMIGDRLGIALGPVEVQLQHNGDAVSPALIAGSSAVLSNRSKGG
jgi:septal ring factor EnvC (AmiA/AmiB activator)